MNRHIIFMIMLFLINWGCASSQVSYQPVKTEYGKKIDIAKYDKIVEGKTTESQVIAFLGEPSRIMEKSDGKILQYMHFQTQYSGSLASSSGT